MKFRTTVAAKLCSLSDYTQGTVWLWVSAAKSYPKYNFAGGTV